MKKLALIGGSGILGLTLGLMLNGRAKTSTFIIAAGLSVFSGGLVAVISDTKNQEKINKRDQELQESKSDNSTLKRRISLLENVQSQNQQLTLDLTHIRECLSQVEDEREGLIKSNSGLEEAIASLQSQLSESQEQIEGLTAEVEEWNEQFHQQVEVASEEKFKKAKREEIERIFQEHDAITSEAMQLFRELQQWGLKVSEGHESKRQLIKNLASEYNRNLDEINDTVNQERTHYLTQIEILRTKVADLQQQLAGDLIEPEYLSCGFDQNGRIANAIAEWLWHNRQIPLKVTGFQESNEVVTAGYAYSCSTSPEDLSRVIEGESAQIARSLGLYALETPKKLEIANVLTVKIRRERPKRKTDKGSLYRSRDEFVNYILSQPVRLRIVGEPGSGKTPTVAILLSHLLNRGFLSGNTPNGQKLPHTIVESCNPLAGISVKNGEVLDFCLRWKSGAKGFKGLADEYKFRKNPANAEYKKQVGYIWITDEIDNTMATITKDEAKPFKDALKDGGHINLGVIVMGQSAMVSTSKGLSIDDQKMMTNIYIDPVSIRTFLTQYGDRFYSKKSVEKALNTLEQIELEIEEQNEIICDTAREFRIAMVTASRSPVFYQLPYFDSGQIDVAGYQQTLAKVTGIREGRGETHASQVIDSNLYCVRDVSMSGHSAYVGLGTVTDMRDKPNCPYCGSDDIRSKGNKWLCKNPDHSKLAPGKPKSWKK